MDEIFEDGIAISPSSCVADVIITDSCKRLKKRRVERSNSNVSSDGSVFDDVISRCEAVVEDAISGRSGVDLFDVGAARCVADTREDRILPDGHLGGHGAVDGHVSVNAQSVQLDVGPSGGGEIGTIRGYDIGSNDVQPGGRFLFSSKKGHLTYAGHLDWQVLLSLVGGATELVWYSVVWERGHGDGDNDGVRYDHTHFAFERKRKLSSRDCRKFDVDGIHPHIRSSIDAEHASRLYWEYHRKEPVQLWQSESGPRRPVHGSEIGKLRGATSLFEACQMFGIVPRSVGDIQLLRADRERRKPAEHDYAGHKWSLELPGDFRVIFMWGRTGTGKTQRAIHAFRSPLVVSQMDDLRDYDPAVFDGIVFDDMDFKKMEGGNVIHLLDWDCDRPIRCRYSNAIIPKHTRKIFTSNKNWAETFVGMEVHVDQQEAIRRRISHVIHVTCPTF